MFHIYVHDVSYSWRGRLFYCLCINSMLLLVECSPLELKGIVIMSRKLAGKAIGLVP